MNTESLFPILCELLFKSAAILVFAGLANILWRGASAASRHMIWALALAALLALPLTKLVAPLWTVELTAKTAQTVLPQTPTPAAPVALTPAVPAIVSAQSWSLPPWRAVLVFVWLMGAVAILGYRFLGDLRLQWLRRQSEPLADKRAQTLARVVVAECGLADTVEVRRSSESRVPLAWGIWQPVVLLPDAAIAWPGQRLAAALRHELGHIRRRDCLARLLGQVACALYWMNPLVWLAARRLCVAQEQACDDLVLRSGANASDYADLLVQTVRGFGGSRSPVRHALAMAQPSTLEARVQAIVDGQRNRRPLGRAALAAGVAAAVALVAASALAQVQEKAGPKEPKQQIKVDAKIVELSASQIAALLPDKNGQPVVSSPAEAEAVIKKMSAMRGVDMLSAPRVIVLSGQQARIQVGREVRFGNEGAKTAFVGVDLDVLPELRKDGQIQLASKLVVRELLPNARDPLTEQSFRERNITATVTLASGQTLVFGGARGGAKGRALLLLLTASLVNDAGEKMPAAAKPGDAEERARRIVIPRTEFQEASPEDVVNFLVSKSRELDPDKKGVNIFVHAPKEAQAARITLNLRDIPLLDAVKYVAAIAGLKMTAGENALMLSPANAPAAEAPRPAGAAAEKAKRIVVPLLEFRDAPLNDVLNFLVAQSLQLDPDKKGVNIVLQTPPDAKPATITLNLRNIPLLEALKYIAQLGGLELEADDYSLRLTPAHVR